MEILPIHQAKDSENNQAQPIVVTSQELQQAFMSPTIAQRGNRGPEKAVPMPKNQWRTNLHKE